MTAVRFDNVSIVFGEDPHSALPQPYLVPVRPAMSRMAHSKGMEGSASSATAFPFKVNSIAMNLLGVVFGAGIDFYISR